MSRYSHLPKALRMAMASRRLGPSIFEHAQFANAIIPAYHPVPWPRSAAEGVYEERQGMHNRLKSTGYLVIVQGTILHERYWGKSGSSIPSNSFSVAKSFVATLVGHGFHEGFIQRAQPIGTLLPSIPAELASITIEQLLMMSTGIQWDESTRPNSDNAIAYYGTDLEAMTHKLKKKKDAGLDFEYVSIATQLLAQCITSASKRDVVDHMTDLWSLLGAEHAAYWNLDHAQGQVKAFCCLYATARDFARLGNLYLRDGMIKGMPYLSSSFVAQATRPSHTFDVLTGKPNSCYGWHWWIVSHRGHAFFYARGIRGQYIICNRKLDMIIVRLGHRRCKVDPYTGHPPDLFVWIDEALDLLASNPS
ncbi:MAG: beta-lactamase family protein [Saprospiraceae bacterium]|nr:beta-lactamase family protein [Saprospiraceae bacterium]